MTFRIVGSNLKAAGRFFDFLEVDIADEQGGIHARDVIRHPGGAGILPVLGDSVLLVRQYRVSLGREIIEIPAGKLDPGEDPLTAANRELEEELGMQGTLSPLGALYVSPGFTDEIIHIYLADNLVETARIPHGAEEEVAEILTIKLTEALAMVADGQIIDAKSQIALLRYSAQMH